MVKATDLFLGAILGGLAGVIVTVAASTHTGREVLKAAARPSPKRTVVVKRSFLGLGDPEIYVV